MPRRHPVPRVWLMTDERLGADVAGVVERLPTGAGIVFRHYRTGPQDRRRLFAELLSIARQRGLVLVRAGDDPMPGEMGIHGTSGDTRLRTWSVHTRAQARRARLMRADAVFVSPLFPTSSHPGATLLSPWQAIRLAQVSGARGIALGGLDARRFAELRRFDFHGWAAIDAWTRQKRNAVPT